MTEAPPATADEWRRRAREFAQRHVRPAAPEMDRTDRMPDGLLAAMRREPFFGLGLPAQFGGAGGSAAATTAVLEELAVESAAIGTLLAVHLSVAAHPIHQWGTEAQRERFLRPLAEGKALGAFALTEPGVGSDAARLSCRYVREGDGYRLDGAKMFITNAALADLVLTFATHDPALGHRGITAFVVPRGTKGFRVAQHLDKLGLRGSETNEIVFDGAWLGPESMLGPEGKGLSIALGALTGGRVGIAACALGVARGAFEEMLLLARRSPVESHRAPLARAYVDVAAASALVAEAARRKDASEPYEAAASAAKLFASQAAVRIASEAIEIGGPDAVRGGARAERLLRDARVFPIVEGTTDIQEMILGRSLLEPEPAAARPND